MKMKLYTDDKVIYLTETYEGSYEVKVGENLLEARELSFFTKGDDWALDHRFSERPIFSENSAPDYLRFENAINPLLEFETGVDENGVKFYFARYFDIICLEMGDKESSSILVLKIS
jgi:hypothetical protein